MKITIVGAGSQCFAPGMVRDSFLSEPLSDRGVELVLMDIAGDTLPRIQSYAERVRDRLGRKATVSATTNLEEALSGATFVICALESRRYHFWRQDYHIPRKYGFRQIYGENGGPGSLFHALRNMQPVVDLARAMERTCPDAWLLNFSNPEHKLCEAVTRLTSVRCVGLCHGFFMGRSQIASLLNLPEERVQGRACGINHFTWFQSLRDGETGEDLYPRLRQAEREAEWLSHWHEVSLGRILFRRFGLWPSPAVNHYGEYIRWSEEFMASELLFFYDPADGHPWQTGQEPEFVYTADHAGTDRPWRRAPQPSALEKNNADGELKGSRELAIPIIEGLACGVRRDLEAVNVPNREKIPNLPEQLVVELPAAVDASGLHPENMAPLPEPIAALIRTQASIHQLLVEAFRTRSKDVLLQAVLLDPVVDSYRRAVDMVEEMLTLQHDVLPIDVPVRSAASGAHNGAADKRNGERSVADTSHSSL
jgi:alpha-galactosidase